MMAQLQGLIETFRFGDLVDILSVAVLLYYLYKQIRDTRAMALLKGLIVLGLINVASRFFDLHVISWLLQQAVSYTHLTLPTT